MLRCTITNIAYQQSHVKALILENHSKGVWQVVRRCLVIDSVACLPVRKKGKGSLFSQGLYGAVLWATAYGLVITLVIRGHKGACKGDKVEKVGIDGG